MTESPRPLIATYRLQLGNGFGFADAVAIVPYLAKLGVSHLYLSPIWQAAAGSTHGYDVVDHARTSHELGGNAGYIKLAETAHRHGLGIVLDIVPNHVGIAHGQHPWWRDVLRYGYSSDYAGHFDIDWEGQPQMRAGILLIPSLGQSRGAALEAGEIVPDFDDQDLVLRYYESNYPLSPRTYHYALGLPSGELLEGADPGRLQDVTDILDRLRDASTESADLLRQRLMEHLRHDPALGAWARERLGQLCGTPGEPATFDRLDELMREQHYRLASWRVSGAETNYRRFFDVNDLAAIRAEDAAVFDDTHRLVREFVASGLVDGLRVDHVDGLYNPAEYLATLAEIGRAHPAGELPIWVEKILGHGESLPEWPIAGTTGYEFLQVAGGLFTNGSNEAAMTSIYDEFTGMESDYAEISFSSRQRNADRAFAGEITVLSLQLHRLAQRQRRHQDNTLRALYEAIGALLASFPVYRTYLHGDEPSDVDRELLTNAANDALRRAPDVPPESLGFLLSVLLIEGETPEDRARQLHFRRRFQQVSGPVMAKGVEDTTFFRYHRLLALNEVGAHPDHFGIGPAQAHRLFAERGRAWPAAMLGTSTHDTKRSEDARARLHVLSEAPALWRREVRTWARGNRRFKHNAGGRPVPGTNTEYYLYQTLVASWPATVDEAYRERIREHMRKAMRESKLHTSWSNVDSEYEDAVLAFTDAILDPRKGNKTVERITSFVARIAGAAAVNSLATVVLKCTTPGVPDIYNGAELPLLALTDPDNRRPVDFASATTALESLGGADAIPAANSPEAKLWLTAKLLEVRRAHLDVFADGANYEPLSISGPGAEHIFAFARSHGETTIAVVVPRLMFGRVDNHGQVNHGALAGTMVAVPGDGAWMNVLTGDEIEGSELDAGTLLERFPVAVLVREGGR